MICHCQYGEGGGYGNGHIPARDVMPRTFDDQPHAGLSSERNSMLNILRIDSWNNKASIFVYTARVCAVGKTSHVVVVGRH